MQISMEMLRLSGQTKSKPRQNHGGLQTWKPPPAACPLALRRTTKKQPREKWRSGCQQPGEKRMRDWQVHWVNPSATPFLFSFCDHDAINTIFSALWQVVGVHWQCSTLPLNGIPSAVPVLPPRRGCGSFYPKKKSAGICNRNIRTQCIWCWDAHLTRGDIPFWTVQSISAHQKWNTSINSSGNAPISYYPTPSWPSPRHEYHMVCPCEGSLNRFQLGHF